MIMREVIIRAEYLSEEGLIFWVKGKTRDKDDRLVDMVTLGHDSLDEAIKHAKSMMKHGR